MQELVELTPARQAVVLLPLGIVLLTCAYTDFKERKVFNKVTYPSLFIGLAVHTIVLGVDGLLAGLLAVAVAFVLGLFLLALGVIGGGDIKLLIVVGAFLGLGGLTQTAFYSVFTGAIGGLVASVFNGYLPQMVRNIATYIRNAFRVLLYRDRNLWVTLERDERGWIPFAIAIFFGGVLAWSDATYDWPGLYAMVLSVWT